MAGTRACSGRIRSRGALRGHRATPRSSLTSQPPPSPRGKLRIAHAIGSKAPLGAVVDKHGQPSTDTAAFYDGGALTTFGGYKGFGLSVMAELMAGMLSGTGSSSDPDYNHGNGTALF